jgi:hypothetical protein
MLLIPQATSMAGMEQAAIASLPLPCHGGKDSEDDLPSELDDSPATALSRVCREEGVS